MDWYNYLSSFGAGLFLANFIPHFIKGVCGDKFPTPFSKPPGKGLSSPLINVLWGLLNMVIGVLLFRIGKVYHHYHLSVFLFFIAFAAMSILHSISFARKEKI